MSDSRARDVDVAFRTGTRSPTSLAEGAVGSLPVVRAAEQAQVVRRVRPTECKGCDVVDVQVKPRLAASTVAAHEGALLAVTKMDAVSDGDGDVTVLRALRDGAIR